MLLHLVQAVPLAVQSGATLCCNLVCIKCIRGLWAHPRIRHVVMSLRSSGRDTTNAEP